MLTSDSNLPLYTKESVLNALVREGFYPEFLVSDMRLLLNYLTRNNVLFQEKHPLEYYKRSIDDGDRLRLTEQFNRMFLCFCEENDLVLLLWKFIVHYKYISLWKLLWNFPIQPFVESFTGVYKDQRRNVLLVLKFSSKIFASPLYAFLWSICFSKSFQLYFTRVQEVSIVELAVLIYKLWDIKLVMLVSSTWKILRGNNINFKRCSWREKVE